MLALVIITAISISLIGVMTARRRKSENNLGGEKLYMYVQYPRERGPMGGVPYIGPRLGGGPIFEVSVAHLDAKERPGKLPTLFS